VFISVRERRVVCAKVARKSGFCVGLVVLIRLVGSELGSVLGLGSFVAAVYRLLSSAIGRAGTRVCRNLQQMTQSVYFLKLQLAFS